MTYIHRTYLIEDMRIICKRLGFEFQQEVGDIFTINHIRFNCLKDALTYIYEKESKK